MTKRPVSAKRFYAWEDAVLMPRDSSRVPFAQLQALVDHVWVQEGLTWPPLVKPLPKQARRTQARATRTVIEAPAELPSLVLLHELAHAMTSTAEGASAGHGPAFVGMYLQLLERYARLPRAELEASLDAVGIPYAKDVKPVFLDP